MVKIRASRVALFISSIVICVSSLSSNVQGQVCGYSIITFYVEDSGKHPIKNVNIRISRVDPKDEYNAHFRQVDKIYWNEERQAHVYQHGLCGSHRNLAVKISADGFDPLEQPIDLPLGWQAFAVTLKHKGSSEQASFKALSCTNETKVCVNQILH